MADNNTQTFLNPSRRSYVFESSKSSGNKKRAIFIGLGILILLALVVFAVIATGGKGEEETPIPSPTLAPTATEAPTPVTDDTTPTPEVSPTTSKASPTPKTSPTPTSDSIDSTSGLDRADLTIEVQNGSGVAGAATKASDFLKKLGYDVVSSGNADNFDYQDTTIQVKSTKKNFLNLLKKDLSSEYSVGSATSDYTGTEADAVVIVGKE